MKQWIRNLTLIATLAVLAGGLAWSGGNVWVSDDGQHHAVAGARAVFIGEDGEQFDVSELADGETRIFGSGEKQIVATREGDVVQLVRRETSDTPEHTVTCRLSSDTCKVLTFADDPEKIGLMIEKRRVCDNDEGDCQDVDVVIGDLGMSGAHVIVEKIVDCEGDDADCAEEVVVLRGGEGGHHGVLDLHEIHEGGHPEDLVFVHAGVDGHVSVTALGDEVAVRCPEGDTTMRVSRDEAEQAFLCPKHSVPLEKIKSGAHKVRRVRIKADK